MKKTLLTGMVVGLLMTGLTGTASALTFFTYDDTKVWLNKDNTSHTWTFDLDNDSLYAGWLLLPFGTADINAEDTIISAYFKMVFSDDERDRTEKEFGSGTIDGNTWFTNQEIDNGFSIANVTSTLYDHMLSVEISRISGDFGVTFTSLWGCYTDNPAPVPEPATMLLLGSGLAGLGAAARRRKAKNN